MHIVWWCILWLCEFFFWVCGDDHEDRLLGYCNVRYVGFFVDLGVMMVFHYRFKYDRIVDDFVCWFLNLGKCFAKYLKWCVFVSFWWCVKDGFIVCCWWYCKWAGVMCCWLFGVLCFNFKIILFIVEWLNEGFVFINMFVGVFMN